jgi:hypothetical protein
VKILILAFFALVFSVIYRRKNAVFSISSQLQSLSARRAAEPLRLRMRGNGRTADERCRNSRRRAQLCGPQARLKSGEPITLKKLVAAVGAAGQELEQHGQDV